MLLEMADRLTIREPEGDAPRRHHNAERQSRDLNEREVYAKILYRQSDMNAFADDLATLALDLVAAWAGWARHGPNPLLLV
jgi:FdhE protein